MSVWGGAKHRNFTPVIGLWGASQHFHLGLSRGKNHLRGWRGGAGIMSKKENNEPGGKKGHHLVPYIFVVRFNLILGKRHRAEKKGDAWGETG